MKETLDVAVIAPEIVKAFGGALRAAVLMPEAARAIAVRYGFRRWPALVVLRDGGYVGAIDGLRNWDEYVDEMTRLAQAPVTRPPTIGIAVTTPGRRRPGVPLTAPEGGEAMKPFPVPVVGPGSQPADDEELQVLAMPRDIATFEMPSVPQVASPEDLRAARDLIATLPARLRARGTRAAPPRGLPLAGVPDTVLRVVNEVMGEGEVSIQVGGTPALRIQESVFAGVWRVCVLDGEGRLADDWLEAAPVPGLALAAARTAGAERLSPVELPQGAMNSPALIAELGQQLAHRRPGAPTHVINLTLFPLTPEDHQVLERALPVGPVAMISRGFGNCRITSTGARDVWRVQYFNSMNTLILNTIEVVDVPEVALAATEDLVDSRERLAELVTWMSESIETA